MDMDLRSLRAVVAAMAITTSDEARSQTSDAIASRVARIEARLLPGTPLRTDDGRGWTVRERLATHRVPGMSVAFVQGGKVAWTRAYGERDASTHAPVTSETIFQAGSISKPIAALALLQLVDAGQVQLDVDVANYLKRWHLPPNRFTAETPVTLRQLLTHQAGVTVRGFDGYRVGSAVPSLVEVLRGASPANSPPVLIDTAPGAINRYSGGGFTIAQMALEDVTGAPLDRWAEQTVFAPLALSRTTYAPITPLTNHGDIASGHDTSAAGIEGRWRIHPEMGAASLWSTPVELATLMIMMQRAAHGDSTPVFSPRAARMMFTPHGPSQGIGIGLKGTTPFRFSHTGSTEGYRAQFIGYLDRDEGIVVMTNGDNGDAVAMEFVRAVAAEYGWEDLAPVVRDTITPSAALRESIAGRYRLGPNWVIEVCETDGQLHAGPTGRRLLPIHTESDSVFFFTAVTGVELRVIARQEGQVSEIEWRQGDRRTRGFREVAPNALPTLAPARPTPQPSTAPSTVLSNITLVDGTGASAQRGMDLVVTSGRIAAVGAHGRVVIPRNARVIELTGKHVIPGLIDAHVHLATYDREPRMHDALLRAAFLGGVTTVRDMGGNIDVLRSIAGRSASDDVPASRFVFSAVMSGPGSMWFTDARSSYVRGPYVMGTSPGVRMVTDSSNVRAAITQAKATGAKGIKLYAELSPALIARLSSEARREGLQVWSHLAIGPGVPSQVLAGRIDVVSHADMFIHELLPSTFPSDSIRIARRVALFTQTLAEHPTMQRLLGLMKQHGTALDATLHIMDRSTRTERGGTPLPSGPAFEFASRMTTAAHRMGIPILVGTDDIGRGTPNVHHELQELISHASLTPLAALHAATLGNARALGVADSLGSAEVGKVADLVILQADPLADIANTLTVEYVMRAGRLHRRAAPLEVLPYMRAPRGN
jgi:CubicO group peptidase (beta-lactamase class C family)